MVFISILWDAEILLTFRGEASDQFKLAKSTAHSTQHHDSTQMMIYHHKIIRGGKLDTGWVQPDETVLSNLKIIVLT